MDNKFANHFSYTYSSAEQKEIEAIRKKYPSKSASENEETGQLAEGKIDTLRRLDSQAERPGRVVTRIALIVGVLLLGCGMSAVMTFSGSWFVPGVIIGVLGIVFVCMAIPLGRKITNRRRIKFAPRILKLMGTPNGRKKS